MKRVRTEHIQMAVSCYLKRRQYVDSDGPLKQGLRLSQTPEEMAANLTGNYGGCAGASWSRSTQGQGPEETTSLWIRPHRADCQRHVSPGTTAVLQSQAQVPLVNTSCRDGAILRTWTWPVPDGVCGLFLCKPSPTGPCTCPLLPRASPGEARWWGNQHARVGDHKYCDTDVFLRFFYIFNSCSLF